MQTPSNLRRRSLATALPLLLVLGPLLLGANDSPGCQKVEPEGLLCDSAKDCEGQDHDACEGHWTCTGDAQCAWECDPEPPVPACSVGPLCGGLFVAPPKMAPPPPVECPIDTSCGCIPSCPNCKDCATQACMPAGAAGGVHVCTSASDCKSGSVCACIPSCLGCDDCPISACVPQDGCKEPNPPCPQFAPPAPGFCADGVIVPGGKDEAGCQAPPSCVKECAVVSSAYNAAVAEAKSCTTDAECASTWLAGLLCQCPVVIGASANTALLDALTTFYLAQCAPSEGWGCGGGCPSTPLGSCQSGSCYP